MNQEIQEIIKRVQTAYSAEDLRVLDEGAVIRAGIEPFDAEFLCSIGVPRAEQLQISFNLTESLPSLRSFLEGRRGYSPSWPHDLRCLNEKYDIVVGIDNSRGGIVVSLDLTGAQPTLIVNSRIRYLVGFMAECVLHHQRYTKKGVDEKHSYQMAQEWMRNLDSVGFNEVWWQSVFEEMETYGNLR